MEQMSLKAIPFYKMSGSGNDFIIIDNRKDRLANQDLPDFIARVCRRAMSVGADGLILVENSDTADFRWRFFNSDGSVAEMCGNGARCVARFAYLTHIAGSRMRFETDAGPISATIEGLRVSLKMTDPEDLEIDYDLPVESGMVQVGSVNTGVPHVVMTVEELETVDVVGLGREIRNHDFYSPAGTNVNFISPISPGLLALRTYERGVEDETLACGTGAVAAALVTASKKGWDSPVSIQVRSGGILNIHFKSEGDRYLDVHLEGDARVIYRGELEEEAWNW